MTQHAEAIWNVADKLRGRPEVMSVGSLMSACRAVGPVTTPPADGDYPVAAVLRPSLRTTVALQRGRRFGASRNRGESP